MIWRRRAKEVQNEALSFEHILVVCAAEKSDEELMAAAAHLANAWNADLTLVAVVEPPAELGWIARATGATATEITDRLIAHYEQKIAALADDAVLPVRPKTIVLVGKPFLEIIRYVITHDVDLVIKIAEQLTGVGGYLFASTDQHLLRKCPCPVWLRLPGNPHAAKTVLAAVDINHAMTAEPETLAGLNRRIVEAAVHLATAQNSVVHLLHAWDALGEGLVRLWSNAPDPDEAVANYVNEVEANHARALDTLADQARSWMGPEDVKRIKLLPRLERGAARDIIPQQVHALDVDVLVMGTIARTGVPGFLIGNTAEDVLNSVDCSVVTVKPPNYVSPVQSDSGN